MKCVQWLARAAMIFAALGVHGQYSRRVMIAGVDHSGERGTMVAEVDHSRERRTVIAGVAQPHAVRPKTGKEPGVSPPKARVVITNLSEEEKKRYESEIAKWKGEAETNQADLATAQAALAEVAADKGRLAGKLTAAEARLAEVKRSASQSRTASGGFGAWLASFPRSEKIGFAVVACLILAAFIVLVLRRRGSERREAGDYIPADTP